MAPHSSTLAWHIPWIEEPGGLQSMGSLRVGHDWTTSLSLFTFMHWRRKWQPTPVFLPENPRDGGAWWAAVYGVTQSRTRLKWLSSSSSIIIIDQETTCWTCLYFEKVSRLAMGKMNIVLLLKIPIFKYIIKHWKVISVGIKTDQWTKIASQKET